MKKTNSKHTFGLGVNAMRTLLTRLLVATALVGSVAACGGDVVDIDRTRAHKVQKDMLEGEWYFRTVVVESQYADNMLFEGLEGDMEKIRFVIEENTLTGYRSYELLEGAESNDTHGDDNVHLANPVVQFPSFRNSM